MTSKKQSGTQSPREFQENNKSLTEASQLLSDTGKVPDLGGALADIPERIRSEELLLESEERYRSLYEGSRDGLCHTDMEGRLLEFNASYQELLGYTAEELFGKSYKEITPACWEAMEDRIVREQIIGRGYSEVYEKEYIRKD
ncbi:MAG: PAS domain S-box protein, partial [Pseudomonadota bacterium]